jgi:predicted ferric reductase
MTLHKVSSIFYLLPSVVLYCIDLALRIFNTNKGVSSKVYTVGSKRNKTSSTFLTISLSKKIKNIEPGSFFLLCCKNISNFEWHPISVVMYNSNENILLFAIKNAGEKSWSNKLNNMKDTITNPLEVFCQGPYSHLKLGYKTNKYKHILFIANGIGITPFFSILNDIQNMFYEGKLNKLEKVIVIWVINHISFLKVFKDIIKFDIELIHFNIYITRMNDTLEETSNNEYYFSNIIYQRPKLEEYIENYSIGNNIDVKDFSIFCCGSYSLLNDVYLSCSKTNIELYTESFSL